jgi:DNA topoisomerase VI subunit B
MKLTIWEKTNVLSGYYIVHYLSGNHKFSVSEEFINHTINTEISYVRDIIIQNVDNIQKQFRKELDEFLHEKKEQQDKLQTMAIIYCQYPQMKISFFGLKNTVDIAKNQVKRLINKHRMRTIRTEFDLKQVRIDYSDYIRVVSHIEMCGVESRSKLED